MGRFGQSAKTTTLAGHLNADFGLVLDRDTDLTQAKRVEPVAHDLLGARDVLARLSVPTVTPELDSGLIQDLQETVASLESDLGRLRDRSKQLETALERRDSVIQRL